jgi:hypothetical protein
LPKKAGSRRTLRSYLAGPCSSLSGPTGGGQVWDGSSWIVAAAAVADGIPLLCVLTLAPSVEDPGVEDGYEGTRQFWQRVGFLPVKELSLTTWNDEHALLLVRMLGRAEGTGP